MEKGQARREMAKEDAVVNRLHNGYDKEVEQLLSQGLGGLGDLGDVGSFGENGARGGGSGGKQGWNGGDGQKVKKKNYGGFEAGVRGHEWDGDDMYRCET
jgi:hypothetical protein